MGSTLVLKHFSGGAPGRDIEWNPRYPHHVMKVGIWLTPSH